MNEFRRAVSDHGSVEGEIKLTDVITFFAKWWKLILGMGLLGAIMALIYINSQSPLYQAQALILMAETPLGFIEHGSIENRKSLVPLSVSSPKRVESPDILLERLTFPTTYPSGVVRECEFSNQAELLRHIKDTSADLNKGIFRFSVLNRSPELATQCAEALFRMIQAQQARLAKMTFNSFNVGSARVQVIFPGAPTRLAAPVYASDKPVSPQKKRQVVAWCASGLFTGLLIALLWTVVTWYRRKTVSNSRPID